jgi:hypothetical protein
MVVAGESSSVRTIVVSSWNAPALHIFRPIRKLLFNIVHWLLVCHLSTLYWLGSALRHDNLPDTAL